MERHSSSFPCLHISIKPGRGETDGFLEEFWGSLRRERVSWPFQQCLFLEACADVKCKVCFLLHVNPCCFPFLGVFQTLVQKKPSLLWGGVAMTRVLAESGVNWWVLCIPPGIRPVGPGGRAWSLESVGRRFNSALFLEQQIHLWTSLSSFAKWGTTSGQKIFRNLMFSSSISNTVAVETGPPCMKCLMQNRKDQGSLLLAVEIK